MSLGIYSINARYFALCFQFLKEFSICIAPRKELIAGNPKFCAFV